MVRTPWLLLKYSVKGCCRGKVGERREEGRGGEVRRGVRGMEEGEGGEDRRGMRGWRRGKGRKGKGGREGGSEGVREGCVWVELVGHPISSQQTKF